MCPTKEAWTMTASTTMRTRINSLAPTSPEANVRALVARYGTVTVGRYRGVRPVRVLVLALVAVGIASAAAKLGLARRGMGVLRRLKPGSAPAAPEAPEIARGDAGWVQILEIKTQRVIGRGRLLMRTMRPLADGLPRFQARVESFAATDGPPAVGDDLLVLIEGAIEHYPATVRAVEPDGSEITIYWRDDELPAPLRELGGN